MSNFTEVQTASIWLAEGAGMIVWTEYPLSKKGIIWV